MTSTYHKPFLVTPQSCAHRLCLAVAVAATISCSCYECVDPLDIAIDGRPCTPLVFWQRFGVRLQRCQVFLGYRRFQRGVELVA